MPEAHKAAAKPAPSTDRRPVRGLEPDVEVPGGLTRPVAGARRVQQTAGNGAMRAVMTGAPLPGSNGAPLPPALRQEMETAFDASFEDVRVHRDAAASESARSVAAKAYTSGKHVYFARDRYAPDTSEGKRLLAHELAHVIQQSRGGRQPEMRAPSSSLEDDADLAARRVAAGAEAVQVGGASGVGIARDEDPQLRKALEDLAAADAKRCAPAHHLSGASVFDKPPDPRWFDTPDAPRPAPDARAHATPAGAPAPKPRDSTPAPRKPPQAVVDFHKPRPAEQKNDEDLQIPPGSVVMLDDDAGLDRPALEARRRERHERLKMFFPQLVEALSKDPNYARAMGIYAEEPQASNATEIPKATPGVYAPLTLGVDTYGKSITIDNPEYWKSPRGRARIELSQTIAATRHGLEAILGERGDIVDSSIVIRKTAEGMVGIQPPPLAKLRECGDLLDRSKSALDKDDLEQAAKLHAAAARIYREASWYWARYKEFIELGGERTVEALGMVRDTSKYTLMVLSMAGGGAFVVGAAGGIAIKTAEAGTSAALGEKVDWQKFGVDVVVEVLLARFGGKLSQGVLGKLARNPAFSGVEKSIIAEALTNGAVTRGVTTTVEALRKPEGITWDELVERVFDPRTMAFDVLLALVHQKLVTRSQQSRVSEPGGGKRGEAAPAARRDAGQPSAPEPAPDHPAWSDAQRKLVEGIRAIVASPAYMFVGAGGIAPPTRAPRSRGTGSATPRKAPPAAAAKPASETAPPQPGAGNPDPHLAKLKKMDKAQRNKWVDENHPNAKDTSWIRTPETKALNERGVLVIKLEPGMVPNDARRKAAALNDLAQRKHVATLPTGQATPPRAKTEEPLFGDLRKKVTLSVKERQKLIEQVHTQAAAQGWDEQRKNAVIARILKMEGDHVQDLQLLGLDVGTNIWALDAYTNQRLGTQISTQIGQMKPETRITEVRFVQ